MGDDPTNNSEQMFPNRRKKDLKFNKLAIGIDEIGMSEEGADNMLMAGESHPPN